MPENNKPSEKNTTTLTPKNDSEAANKSRRPDPPVRPPVVSPPTPPPGSPKEGND